MANKKIPADATKVFSTKLFEVYTKEQEQFDGSVKTFERVRTYDTAKALCIVDDTILIVHTELPWEVAFVSLPWWMMDFGESSEEWIKREVEEETGIVFESYEKLYSTHSNIGLVENYKDYYIARNPIHRGEQQLDAGWEKIRIEYISFDKMIEFMKQGKVFRDLGDWILRKYILPGKTDELRKLLFQN